MPTRLPFVNSLQQRVVPSILSNLRLSKVNRFSTSAKCPFGLRPKRVSSSGSPVLLEASRAAALQRRQLPARTGALAYKKGMTAVFRETGERIPCTVLQLDRVQVTAVKDRALHGYWAVQVGLGWRNPKNVTRPLLGHYETCGVAPKKTLCEFRVQDQEGLLQPGTTIKADHFHVGQYVDVRAISKGKGFAGGMKRHGFSGQPASHGNSLTHRAMGSAGQSQGGGSRVLPGKRMAGRMGGQQHTIQNLKVLDIQPSLGIVVVSGCVTGPKGCVVKLQDAIKKPTMINETPQAQLQ
ncbi:mitochondrial 54S ribosomal protein YmL9 [Geopyxis carbonaria]|nr:mitochondrial 54S ribosomal protein YmL9 [Geopyxis carbonaria]